LSACGNPQFSRSTCLAAEGSVLNSGPKILTATGPGELQKGQSCVESGHAGATKGVIYVSVDNPRIWTETDLGGVRTSEGSFSQELVSENTGWNCAYCSFDLQSSGGDGSPSAATNISGTNAAVNEDLTPWTDSPGHWGGAAPKSFNLVTGGGRVGYRPLVYQMYSTSPPQKHEISAFPISVQLDPHVLLVPVQAVVLRSQKFPSAAVKLSEQLALWDRIATVTNATNVTNGDGEFTGATRIMAPFIGTEFPADISPWWVPDDIWTQCDIQFRLVNFLDTEVADSIASPSDNDSPTTDTPLLVDLKIIEALPGYIAGIPTVVFAYRCTPPTGTIDSGGETEGNTIASDNVICVNTVNNDPVVPAHELGHYLQLGHEPCSDSTNGRGVNASANNVMCAAGGGDTLLPAQCTRARQVAATVSIKYFPHSIYTPIGERVKEFFGKLLTRK
jgi:hypothetical protein